MTELAPEWVRASDPVIRSPARYRWTMAPAFIGLCNIEYFSDLISVPPYNVMCVCKCLNGNVVDPGHSVLMF